MFGEGARRVITFGPAMTDLLPFRFSTILSLGGALLLSSCCANNECDCKDEPLADAVVLRFLINADSLAGGRGFGRLDVDTIIIQRSPRPFKATIKPETVTLIRTAAQARDSVVLNNNTPFGQVTNFKLNHYRYVVQYLKHLPNSKPIATTIVVIDSVQLKGRLDGTGCCTCYTNSQKTVYASKPKRLNPAQDSAFVVDLKQKPYYLGLTK